MATEKWIAGSGSAGLTWTAAITGTTLNSLANGNALLSDVQIANQTDLNVFCDVSIVLASAAFAGSPYVGVYLYPLNKDGSTYGDGRFGSAAAGPPAGNYLVGSIGLVAATQAQVGSFTGIITPPGAFKFLLYNAGGVNWASSGNTFEYRTYNRSIA